MNASKKQFPQITGHSTQNYEFFDRYNRNYDRNSRYQNRLLFDEMKLYRVENIDYNKDLVLNLYINEVGRAEIKFPIFHPPRNKVNENFQVFNASNFQIYGFT